MLDCKSYQTLIQLYADGELFEDASELLKHVEDCTFCRGALEEEQFLSARIRAARPGTLAPETLRLAVERRLREKQSAELNSSPAESRPPTSPK